MSLKTDAKLCTNHANLAKDKIKWKVLSELEKDLERHEKISILFLMTPLKFVTQSYRKLRELLRTNDDDKLIRWIKNFEIEDWEEKLLEALLIIKNFEIVKKLGFSEEERNIFSKRYQIALAAVSPNLERVLKTLYFLCDDLGKEETKLLISILGTEDINTEDELELSLLYWIEKGLISALGGIGLLSNLLQALKQINYSKNNTIYQALDHLNCQEDIRLNVQDSQQSLVNSLQLIVVDNVNKSTNNSDKKVQTSIKDYYEFKRGLLIIINQEKFDSEEYRERKGSEVDVKSLESTFTNFGFEVDKKENLTESEFYRELNRIRRFTIKDYHCIILCILSHGEESTFVSRDCRNIDLNFIEERMCSSEMKGVVKILIVQACQGPTLGVEVPSDLENPSEGRLTFDGPSTKEQSKKDCTRLRDFVMFIATVSKFKSIRNEKKGTWFIQTLCKVLNADPEIYWHDLAVKVKGEISQKRDTVRNEKNAVQTAEEKHNRLTKKFLFKKKENPNL